MKALCVYCGSSLGSSSAYSEATRTLAAEMVKAGISLVYGGGNVGLMGVIADEVMRLGGTAIGVIPHALLEKEVGHCGLHKLHVVKDMHERKALMAQLSDGFIALPGGLGTLEELFETLTWAQLGLHEKPVGLLNVNGFYDALIRLIQHLVEQRFVSAEQASLMMHETAPQTLLKRFACYAPTYRPKWINRETARTLLP